MKRKNIAGLIAIVAIVAVTMFAGCVEEEQLSTAEIKAMVLATAEEIDTYKFDMDMTQKTLISNETSDMEMTSISTGKGAADNINKKMKMELTTTMELPEGAPQETMEMTMEMYFVNNAMYMKMDLGIPEIPAQWTKMQMPEGYEESWESQNQVELQMELLNVSEVELLEDEEVNGVDCYVLNITIDVEKYWEIVMKQKGMSELMQNLQQNVSFDIGKMMKGMSMKYWVAKDTKFPMKTEMQMEMVISSEDLNIPESEEEFTMTMDQRTTMVFYDYNEPVTIELPEEAESAIEGPMIPMPS
jgi:hypothetical protein